MPPGLPTLGSGSKGCPISPWLIPQCSHIGDCCRPCRNVSALITQQFWAQNPPRLEQSAWPGPRSSAVFPVPQPCSLLLSRSPAVPNPPGAVGCPPCRVGALGAPWVPRCAPHSPSAQRETLSTPQPNPAMELCLALRDHARRIPRAEHGCGGSSPPHLIARSSSRCHRLSPGTREAPGAAGMELSPAGASQPDPGRWQALSGTARTRDPNPSLTSSGGQWEAGRGVPGSAGTPRRARAEPQGCGALGTPCTPASTARAGRLRRWHQHRGGSEHPALPRPCPCCWIQPAGREARGAGVASRPRGARGAHPAHIGGILAAEQCCAVPVLPADTALLPLHQPWCGLGELGAPLGCVQTLPQPCPLSLSPAGSSGTPQPPVLLRAASCEEPCRCWHRHQPAMTSFSTPKGPSWA